MNAARKGAKSVKPRAKVAAPQMSPGPAPPPAVCRRCGAPGPVGEGGFCEKCEQALEQACL